MGVVHCGRDGGEQEESPGGLLPYDRRRQFYYFKLFGVVCLVNVCKHT